MHKRHHMHGTVASQWKPCLKSFSAYAPVCSNDSNPRVCKVLSIEIHGILKVFHRACRSVLMDKSSPFASHLFDFTTFTWMASWTKWLTLTIETFREKPPDQIYFHGKCQLGFSLAKIVVTRLAHALLTTQGVKCRLHPNIPKAKCTLLTQTAVFESFWRLGISWDAGQNHIHCMSLHHVQTISAFTNLTMPCSDTGEHERRPTNSKQQEGFESNHSTK